MSKQQHDKGRKPRPQERTWEWRDLHFTETITPGAAVAALEHLAASPQLGVVVMELRADASSARWLIGVEPKRIPALKQLLSTHLPVRALTPRRVRSDMEMAAKLHLSGHSPAIGPVQITTAIRALYGVCASLADGEKLTLQLLLGRRVAPHQWQPQAAPGWVDLLLGQPSARPARKPAPARQEQHGFDAMLRIGATGSLPGRLRQLITEVRGALRGLESSDAHLTFQTEKAAHLNAVRLPWRWPLRLRSGELAALTGWPIGDPPLPLFGENHPRMLAPKHELASDDRQIGVLAAPGFDDPVAIPIGDAAHHTALTGPTGSGKSTVMLSLITADIRAGRGVLVLDPKGDLAADVLARIPDRRHSDVVVIDPTASHPVGFNPLAGDPALAPVTADTLLGIFEALFKENWGIRTADVLSAAFLTLARIPEANLLWLQPLLTNPEFRRRVLKDQQDPLGTESFWRQYDAKRPDAQATEIAPVLNKLRQLILRPGLRATLGQAEPRFDIGDLFTKRRIVIVNLNRGLLGADASKLLGTLLIGQLWAKLLERQKLPQTLRSIVSIYIDEAPDFISGLPQDLSAALAQARSLGGAFTLANQFQAQYSPAMQEAVDANTRNKIYFGMSGRDASTLAKHMPGVESQDLMLLPKFHAYANVLQQGQQTGWMTIKTAPPCATLSDPAELYAASHARYGVPAQETEQAILKLIEVSADSTSDEPENGTPIGRVGRVKR